jgi:hypothetical protein
MVRYLFFCYIKLLVGFDKWGDKQAKYDPTEVNER